MAAAKVATETLNFSWLIEGEVAGCAAPMSKAELAYLRSQGIRAIVRLAYPDKDDFVIDSADVKATGLEDLQVPVQDFHAPSPQQIEAALRFVEDQVRLGRPVVVSCGAGCGRTGTVLACYLITRGYSAGDAWKFLLSKRPCSDEIDKGTPAQKKAIYEFERRFKVGAVHLQSSA